MNTYELAARVSPIPAAWCIPTGGFFFCQRNGKVLLYYPAHYSVNPTSEGRPTQRPRPVDTQPANLVGLAERTDTNTPTAKVILSTLPRLTVLRRVTNSGQERQDGGVP